MLSAARCSCKPRFLTCISSSSLRALSAAVCAAVAATAAVDDVLLSASTAAAAAAAAATALLADGCLALNSSRACSSQRYSGAAHAAVCEYAVAHAVHDEHSAQYKVIKAPIVP
jgi:hypothetical protein